MNIENVNFSAKTERAILNLALKVELKAGQRFRATKSLDALSRLDRVAAGIPDKEIQQAHSLFRENLSPGQYAALYARQAKIAEPDLTRDEKREQNQLKRRMVYRGKETWG